MKSFTLGRTDLQQALLSELSRANSAAKTPWTLILPMGLEIDFGTVRIVRRAVVGTVRSVSSAWAYVRKEWTDTLAWLEGERLLDPEWKITRERRAIIQQRCISTV